MINPKSSSQTVLAIDLGAESGRVMAVNFDPAQGALALEELHRFPNVPVTVGDTLHWDILRLWGEIEAGLAAGVAHRPAALGLDTWGVDFALLDGRGRLLGNPVHYRDARTEGMMAAVFERIPRVELFARTGIQMMPINTLYQLMSLVQAADPQLAAARNFLTIPDLLNYWLTGEKISEWSNATTTQMIDARTGGWAVDLLTRLDVPTDMLPPLVPSGTRLGRYEGVPVIAPACHDTGSAVAALPAANRHFAYISSGTWSLVGLETAAPLLTSAAAAANITNEGGAFGRNRLLKNVMGLWIVQQCRTAWAGRGELFDYEELAALAAVATPLRSLINPDDGRFLPPGDHPALVQAYCRETDQPVPASPGAVVRSVLESLALAYRRVIRTLVDLTGQRVTVIHVVGGGSQNALLNQMTADAAGIPVLAGPVEATVLGNALVQLITLGELEDLDEARALVARLPGLRHYQPAEGQDWAAAAKRFETLINPDRS